MEDPAGHHRGKGAAEPGSSEPAGTGRSADGLARARVTPQGRVAEVSLSGQAGAAGRAEVETAVRDAVNAALDDMAGKIAETGALAGLQDELGRITGDFERAMDQVAADISAARARLDPGTPVIDGLSSGGYRK